MKERKERKERKEEMGRERRGRRRGGEKRGEGGEGGKRGDSQSMFNRCVSIISTNDSNVLWIPVDLTLLRELCPDNCMCRSQSFSVERTH